MTIGDYLLRRLSEAGVGHLSGIPGDQVESIMDPYDLPAAIATIGFLGPALHTG
jgi:TPP-dependent 2-oxoacid decarboxylase